MLRFASGAGRIGRVNAIGICPHPDAELARHHRAHLLGRREAGTQAEDGASRMCQ